MIGLATGGLVAAVWQGVLLAMVVGLALRLLPKTPAAVRFAIWFTVFAVVTALPVASLWPRKAGAAGGSGHVAWLTLDVRWSLAIAAVWAAASLARAGMLAIAAFRVRALWKRATPVEVRAEIYPTHRDTTGMNGAAVREPNTGIAGCAQNDNSNIGGRRAQLCVSDEVDRPTVIGFFAPKIVIPSWLLEKLTPAELQQIVIHEAGHLGRADDWMNLLQKIALVVFPLNPALAWVERRLCFERELAVDERVLKAFAGKAGAAKAYAACLATVAEHRLQKRGLALALGALGRESELGQRVGRILKRGEAMRPVHAKLVLGGAMLGLAAAAAGLERCPQVVGFAPNTGQTTASMTPGRVGGGLIHAGIREMYQPVMLQAKIQEKRYLQENSNVTYEVLLKAATDGPGRETGVPQRLKPQPIRPGYGTAKAAPLAKTDVVYWADRLNRVAGQPDNAGRVVQWVVVTAWRGEDGSRMMLTAASLPDETGQPVAAGSAVPTGDQDGPQGTGKSEDLHPYAAVPVRGGWLVFQL